MSFDFLSLFTGAGSAASPPPPPAGGNNKPAARAPAALSKEQAALMEARRHCADLEKRQQGHQNQATRYKAEAKSAAATNRPRAMQLLDEGKRDEALAEALGAKIRDARASIAQLERTMGLVAHAKMTRSVQEAMSGLHAEIDVSAFEEARDALHETAGELDELDAMIDTPVGLSRNERQMTDAQRTSSLDQELDELVNGDLMDSIDSLRIGETRAEPQAAAAATAAATPTGRTAVAMGSSSSAAPSVFIAQGTDARMDIAQRLKAARSAARTSELKK